MAIFNRKTEGKSNLVFVIDGKNPKSSFQTDTRAASFDRISSEYLSSPSIDFRKGNEPFSLGCWVKFDSLDGAQGMIGKWSINQDAYLIYKHPTNEFEFIMSNLGNNFSGDLRTSGAAIAVGVWYFVVVVFDPSDIDNQMKISFNNSIFITSSNTLGAKGDSSAPFSFGAYDGSNYIDGQIDNAFFYDKALSQTEVSALYNSNSGTSYDNLTTAQKIDLVSWWSLNETADIRYDKHGTNNLTDNNTVTYDIGKVSETDYFWSRDLVDSSDGTPQNGVELVDGFWEFDGVDDYINFDHNLNITRSSTITTSIWVKNEEAIPTGFKTVFYIGTSDHGADDHLLSLAVRSDKTNYFHSSTDGAEDGGSSSIRSNTAFTMDEWNNIVLIKRGVPTGFGTISMYINGQEVTTGSENWNGGDNEDRVVLGNSWLNGSPASAWWGGQISKLKIYDRELTSDEIIQNYTAQKSRFGK